LGTRLSLRPLFIEGHRFPKLGQIVPRERERSAVKIENGAGTRKLSAGSKPAHF
jgi:hypothetical protein